MPEWLLPVSSLAGSVAVLLLTYFGARRLGLTDLQKAVRVETDALVARLRDRVALLENENKDLHAQVDQLVKAGSAMRVRIDDLEEALANVAVKRNPRRAEA